MPEPVPLTAQLAEARRELRLRHRAYPRMIHAGSLDPDTAQRRLARMAAIVQTLERLVAAANPQQGLFPEEAKGG